MLHLEGAVAAIVIVALLGVLACTTHSLCKHCSSTLHKMCTVFYFGLLRNLGNPQVACAVELLFLHVHVGVSAVKHLMPDASLFRCFKDCFVSKHSGS